MQLSRSLKRIIIIELFVPVALFTLGIYHGLMQTISRAGLLHDAAFLKLGYYQGLTLHGQRRDMGWIIRFVNSSQSLIKNGDKDAVALYEKFNKLQMPDPDRPDLREIEIKSLVEFIKSEKTNLTASDAPFATPEIPKANYRPLSNHNYGFILSYLALIGVLVAVLFFAVNVGLLKRNAAPK